jgi:hypothetical protein
VRPPAYQALVDKSRAACIAAVETYNRPSAHYREENFAILMINAWELLLKARIVRENRGKLSSVYARDSVRLKNGKHGKRKKVRLTRYGSPHTIGIVEARNIVQGYKKDNLEEVAAANVTALLDIRDHATHFVASNINLRNTLAELSLAAVRNYIVASQKWFRVTYADLNLAAVPISFSLNQNRLEAVAKSTPVEVARFLAHVKSEESRLSSTPSEYVYSVVVNFDIIRKSADGAIPIKIAALGEVAQITVSIDDDKLPPGMTWSFKDLVAKLKKRYSNFVQDNEFYKIKREIESNKSLCHERRLVPSNKNSPKTRFYNPNIIFEFDKYYTQKISRVSPSQTQPYGCTELQLI